VSYITLTVWDLALAALLLLINGAMSFGFGLRLERTLLTSTARMVLQLAVLALLLRFIFATDAAWPTLLFALLMLAATAYEVTSRQSRPIKGWRGYALAGGPPFLAGLITTMFAAIAIVGADPWYAPRYFLPILGMIVGNALAGAGLVLDAMSDGAARDRQAIEARLALGHSRFDAMSDAVRRSVHAGMLPILSTMATAGIVAIPGMMTGQILAGADPAEAAKYQVMILFLIAGATGLAVLSAAYGSVLLLTDERHRLRLDRMQSRPGSL
jgi:putative ABC transport system permease protein